MVERRISQFLMWCVQAKVDGSVDTQHGGSWQLTQPEHVVPFTKVGQSKSDRIKIIKTDHNGTKFERRMLMQFVVCEAKSVPCRKLCVS